MLKTPYGTNDFLPDETATKRIIEQKIMQIFSRAGYDEVVTPTMEYLDTLTNNRAVENELFKMFDLNNKTLALRHEMTTPIARLVASRLKNSTLPIKLSYNANVFRFRKNHQIGRQCEFYQAGVELVGVNNAAADAEIIYLAAKCLQAANLTNFKICLGQVQFVQGLLDNLPTDTQAIVKDAIVSHNLVALENLGDKIKNIPTLQGGVEILHKAKNFADNKKSVEAVDNLLEIYNLLEVYGVANFITFDLGLVRDFDYYSGMIFEIYAPNVGFSLAGGGHYFLANLPCTGFALGIERLIQAAENILPLKKDFYISYQSDNKQAINKAVELRNAGYVVELAFAPQSKLDAETYKNAKGFSELIYFEQI